MCDTGMKYLATYGRYLTSGQRPRVESA
jgi:hypothetical protein